MLRDDTYASTVNSVIDPAKLFQCRCNEVLHTLLIGYVQSDCKGSVICLFGIFLALLGSLFRPFLVEICENDSVDTSLGERKASVFADSRPALFRHCQNCQAVKDEKNHVRQPPMQCHQRRIKWKPFSG